MKKSVFRLFILIASLSVLLASCSKAKKELPPNIVIILADDLGYGDPKIYNPDSKIPTPNIDQLAKSGMRFTDAHTPSSVCSPTRYGLLTGRYAWRTELKKSVLWMWDKPLINANRPTLPRILKQKNYITACIGKWHLGWRWPSKNTNGYMNDTIAIGDFKLTGRNDLWKEIDFSKPLGGGPLEAGFDYYFGDDVPNFAPYAFFENNKLTVMPDTLKPKDMFGGPGPMADGWRLDRVMPKITEKAISYIKEQSVKDSPFFLYFALTAPHTPIAPTEEFKGKSEAGPYGDFVYQVDWSVGQIIEALRTTGELENTLVIFTSDNGSPQRDGTAMSGPIASVKAFGHDPSKPWKGMKADIWEGGHRVPFIASWQNKITPNTISEQLIGLTDLFTTLTTILDIPTAEKVPVDSFDISPILFGKDNPIRNDIVHHSIDGTFAIRKQHWKLILGKDSGGFSKNLDLEGIPVTTNGQLYNLLEDPAESNNVYDQNPEKVKELSALLKSYKDRS